MFATGLKDGQTVSNRQLMNIFHCACEGGIRYSSRTNTLVLVVNNTKEGLPNKMRGNTLKFAGRPFKKAGEFSGANKRLRQFFTDGGDIFLFVVNKPGEYEYQGRLRPGGQIGLAKTDAGLEYPVFPLLLEEKA